MSRRSLGRAFVRVVAIWAGSLMFFSAPVAYGLIREWTGVEPAIRDLGSIRVVFSEMWIVTIYYTAIVWSTLAGVAGLALLGVWLAGRYLPWRRWLQLDADTNSV